MIVLPVKEEDSVSRFLHSIDKYAKRQQNKIIEEIKQIERERLKKEEQKIVESARTLMMSELSNVKTEVFMKVSNARSSSVQKISQRKSDIENEIFESCEYKIKEYTNSEEYKDRLRLSVNLAFKKLNAPLSIYVRDEDLNYINETYSDSSKYKVYKSDKIKKGGLFFCKDGVVLDDTFDTSMANQKKSFSEKYFSKIVGDSI